MSRTFTLKQRLIGAFAVVVVLFAGVLTYNVWTMAAINDSVDELVDQTATLDAVQAAESAALKINRHALRVVAMADADRVADQRTQAAAEKERAVAAVAALRAAATADDLPLIETFEARFTEADELFGVLFASVEAGDVGAAQDVVRERCVEVSAALNDGTVALVEHFEAKTAATAAGAAEAYRHGRSLVIGAALAVALLAFLLGWFVSRGVVRRVSDSASQLTRASEQLTAVSDRLTVASDGTTSQANVVASAGEQVSSNIQTVATAIEEMSASVHEIAGSAGSASEVAADAVRRAEATNQTVLKLGESSARISAVIELITSIAEQTNLLALNATIEAARAGEAGKGFAVVANEVKELAKETAAATEEISARIATIQEETGEAVAEIEQIGAVIARIADIQTTIASAVEEQTATTSEISRNVAEAAQGSAEIAENILTVAAAAQGTSEDAANTAGSARDLTDIVGHLDALVGQRGTASPAAAGDRPTAPVPAGV
ncbi:methyl-accepting chemotaxis protein [Nitriliruptor alkaliphilus]|uniref:methyl-accepting chemotaxis protein n=1 Tax=Nitriliruptor alkaliphilus TaxID=427918 RepID=UPI000696F24E|nr:methyl-accepting chemotaxis protein [Nitriliruptor alkaliphilus]